MYRIKKLTNCGNIDFDQNPYEVKYGTQTLVDIKHKKLSKLRDLINSYIDEYDLGSGNFIPPKVYRNKKLPKKYGWFYGDSYETYRVFNGDKSDLRFNDPKNVIVGLYAKGRALKDQTGFVQDV